MSMDVERVPFPQVMQRVGELADSLLSNPDPHVRERAEELLDWIDVFHREGLGRLVDLIVSWRGELFLETASQDEVAGAFLSAYDMNVLEQDEEGG